MNHNSVHAAVTSLTQIKWWQSAGHAIIGYMGTPSKQKQTDGCSPPGRRKNIIRTLKSGETVPLSPPRRYTKTSDGYVNLRWWIAPYTYVEVREHRVVDGRVTEAEHVHHENRDRSDNSQENLIHLSAADHLAEHASAHSEEIASLYADGWSTVRIGKKIGIDSSAVWRNLNRRGLIERGRRYGKDPDVEEVRRLHEAGVRVGQMMAIIGYPRCAIIRVMDAAGIKRYPPGRIPGDRPSITQCPQGHPYSQENTYRSPGAPGQRACRACHRDRERNRKKEARANL